MKRIFSSTVASFFLVASFTGNVFAAEATKYKNCTALNKVYPGGVSQKGAVDMTKKKGKLVAASPKKSPVVDDAVYEANKKLDRDKDGIACEK